MAHAYAGPDSELAPDPVQAKEFLNWWFEKTNHGVLEIGWMDPRGYGICHFQQFERNDLDALIATAVQANLVPGQAMYFRASTVRAHPMRDAASGERIDTVDADVMQSPGVWSDMDKEEDVEHAKSVQSFIRPNASVITGTVPSLRVQSWFRASEPIVSGEMTRTLNIRLHKLFGGDGSVINPSRLMRLPGMIAWPIKPGRVPEIVQFVRPGVGDKRPSSYPLSTLTSQLPDHEQQATRAAPAATLAGLSTVSTFLSAIRSGNGWHDAMIRLVAHWVGRGWSSVEIQAAAVSFTLPDYSADQTYREVAKAIEGARQKWGVADQEAAVFTEPAKPFGESIVDPWDTLKPPPFPYHILPSVLAEYAETRGRVMGADPCALAWSALSACSAALDGRTRLKMKRHDTWTVPPSLWVALVGRSSSKKTPIISESWHTLETVQNRALRAYADQKKIWDQLSKEDKNGGEPPPRPRRLVSHDATMESVQELLACQDRGLGILRDELAGFIGSLDKYSGNGRGGAADRAFFLQSYNGGSHVVDRVGRGTVAINNLLVTICGGIQPDRLAQFGDLADDGMWQRFIPIIVAPGTLGTDDPAVGESVSERFALRLESMIDASRGDTASMSEAAHGIRGELERELFALEQSEPLGSKFASFTGKLPGLFGRLCLVLSYLEPQGLGYVISERTATVARRLLMDCVLPHAAQVYLTMGAAGGSLEATQAIAGFILAKRHARIVASDLTSGVRVCRNQPVAEIGQMVSPLVAGGWLLPETEMPGNRAWLVNPTVHILFANRAAQEISKRNIAQTLLIGEGEC